MKASTFFIATIFFVCWLDISESAVVLQKNGTVKLTESEIRVLLDEYNTDALGYCNKNGIASWEVQTNIGDIEKQKEYEKISAEYAEFRQKYYTDTWSKIPVESTWTIPTQRELASLKVLGAAALPDQDYRELLQLQTNMSAIYSSAKICPYKKQNCTDDELLTLDPEIEDRLAKSEDYDELAYVWKSWRDNSGKLMRSDYKKYVDLSNKAAIANGFPDASKWWQDKYEDDKFVEKIDALWLKIEPLYNELHKYVKYHLYGIYGKKMDYSNDDIPAHLLGNMWAQSWEYLYDRTKPFKNGSLIDVTDKMKELDYNAYKMFELSNEFYLSMGLEDNKMSYNPPSIIEKPTNRTITCHASAWDFCDGKDFRIKMCTNVNMKDFVTIHHEMGHIQYYLQYKSLPLALRGGANPGFHEAVGDTIALAVSTPQHLQKVGLLENYADTQDDNINALYKMALERVAFLPFGLLIDKWRWDVFSGVAKEENWNKHWWDLRKKYQKVSPPVARDENDFDPGAKYHVPANSQYIAYFVAHVLEFQMYKSLCEEANEFPGKDLHKCDFFESKEAGKKLSDGLKLGTSKSWPDALEAITGTRELDADALLQYFDPLYKFLQKKNIELQEEHKVRLTLETYDTDASNECNTVVTAEWNSITDLNDKQKEEDFVKASLKYAEFKKEKYESLFKHLKGKEFADEKIQRQITFLTQLDKDILDEKELEKLENTVLSMVAIYNKAKVCPYNEKDCDLSDPNVGWTLDPEIDRRMAESSDYDELEYIWKNWHDNSGKLMRNDYKNYVQLMNDAAKLNGFNDAGEMWKFDYEDPYFAENMDKLWQKIEPLYNELHRYVVRKLSKIYPDKIKETDEYLPANVLGNMWAQSWVNLYERIKPFNASDLDVTSSMEKLKYTAEKMMKVSDEFYGSLGLESNEMSYTGDSIIEKPPQLIVCHASAWDFCNGNDFRIKMCTKITQEDFITVHHEMGHIQYFILYKDQPLPFRNGANPGFHEAVGDTIALSVGTPKHLEKIGLLEGYDDSEEDNINSLFKIALERIAFIPFGLLVDTYRWDIFSGTVNESHWNEHWEFLRKKYQKVVSPVERNETHFDAGAKYHVAANSQYMNYFFAHILEFQLYRAMCIAADQYQPGNNDSQPLHKCDFYQSQKAGDQLRAGLNMGQSKPWPEILKVMTGGESDLSADAILEYFDPLLKYLKEANKDQEPEEPDEPDDNLVPIIVGSVLGGLLALSLIGYCIFHFKKRRRNTV